MKRKNAWSLLLCLALLLGAVLPATTAYAENNDSDNGMHISKTAVPNTDGSYTITLEAYATGSKVISEVTKDIPTDIVLVLDQSGSMARCITCGNQINSSGQTHNTYAATNTVNTNGTYYIKNGSSYTRVNYCNGTHRGMFGATSQCSGGPGWYTSTNSSSHTAQNKITPKTSENPNGTQFYSYVSEACTSRLNALKTAVTSFADQVAQKAAGADGISGTLDDIDHRIAVVGFASQSGNGNNTELLSIAGRNSGSVGVAYNNISNQNLKDVMQSMRTNTGKTMVTNAINALAAEGATQTDLGMDMAQRILNANPVPQGEKRNRVVIVFTDGAPTGQNGFQNTVANSAINTAEKIKTGGTTVYAIGVFSGADATSTGTQPTRDYTDSTWGSNYTDAEMSAACNWFMQQVSSNNGTPQSPSYYLSAGDAASLNNIFQQISSQIEEGGSFTTLSESTVIKDIISPQFTLPDGATASNITLETYACTGVENDGKTYTWLKNDGNPMGAKATITSTNDTHATTTNNQVSVTGFDFAANYVGTVTENGNTTYRGNKLVISFNVKPRPGFLGGNEVITNSSAGVYPDKDATDPVLTFEQPQVDVTIKEPQITLPDANVYLGAYFENTVSSDDLKEGTTIKFGDDIVLDLTKPNENWGLEDWQTEYVDIVVKITDKDGKEITKLEKLTEDTDYKVSVSIKPKKTTNPENNGYDEIMTGTIHVFKPELTFKDSTAYYGEPVPTDNNYSSNYVANSEKWKNGNKYSTDADVEMLGTKPTLTITYTPDASKLENGKYTKQDVPVKATVMIGTDDVTSYTTFVHQDCTDKTCTLPDGYHFWIHIQTCTLTIAKFGGNTDEPYVFTVYKDKAKYSEVTVMGGSSETIYELPVGTYTIEEDTGWSWRFTGDNGNEAKLSAETPTGSITASNTLNKPYWLNGFSQVVKNIFGVKN